MADPKETAIDELEPGHEEPPPKEEEVVETPPKVEESELAGAIRELRETVAAGKKEETKTELSKEQVDEMWAVYDPEKGDKDFYKKFFRLNPDASQEDADAVKGLFADVQKGLVKQSMVGARNFDKLLMEEIDKKYGPVLDFVTRAETRERQDRFYDTYPVLKESAYSKVIDGVAKSIADQEFDSENDYFKALADGAAELIKSVKPDFDLGAKPQQTGKTPKLPRSSGGGGGGAGKAPKKDETKTSSDDRANELEPDWQG